MAAPTYKADWARVGNMFKFGRKKKEEAREKPAATEDSQAVVAETGSPPPVESPVPAQPDPIENAAAVHPPAEAPEPAPAPAPQEPLKKRLAKPRAGFGDRLKSLFSFKRKLDDELFEELETLLLTSDVGAETTMQILDELTAGVKRKELQDGDAVMAKLRSQLTELLQPCQSHLTVNEANRPHVILVVGVNGAGKTTTMGKLALRFGRQGKNVMMAAGDTFRAAAVEQLKTWGERTSTPVIAQDIGADSASVIFDAVQSAQSRACDILLADTAGRLHTQSNLMEELKKVKRVIGKLDDTAPHEVLLVIDGATGQNAISQAEQFHQAVNLTGIVITKLDGSAKGGVLFALARKLGLPIRLIGVGEKAEDLRDFNAAEFVDALMPNDAV